LSFCIFNQDRSPPGDAVHAALQPAAFKQESDLRAQADAGACRPFVARNQAMCIRPVPKMPVCNRLKTRSGAVALYPAELFDKVDEFMFKNPLQRFQAGTTLHAAHGDGPVLGVKTVEEQPASDRDLKENVTGIRPKAGGPAARFCHSCR